MIRKAVIPAAGFGTRFLPATKSQPKEMLPIIDTPTIQHVVEEAVESGITDILMIIGKGKRSMRSILTGIMNLRHSFWKEYDGRIEFDEENKFTGQYSFYISKELNGLGDAISYAKYHVNGEPFAVLLGDTLIESNNNIPVTRQLIEVYNEYKSSVVALEEVHPSLVSRYGIMDGKEIDKDIFAVHGFIEKPDINNSPSNLAIASRYIFTPEIFDYLDSVKPGKNNEIQITDAMQLMIKDLPWYGLKFDGRRHDIGNKLDFLKTNVVYGLKREDIGDEFRQWLKDYISD